MTNFVSLGEAAFPGVNLKFWLIGALIATMSYGIVLSLVLAFLHNFIQHGGQRSKQRGMHEQRRVRCLFAVYTLFMFSLSTLAFVSGSLGTVDLLFASSEGVDKAHALLRRFSEAICVVLASWAADALMVWRCIGLYQATSKANRVLLYSLLVVISLLSLGTGMSYIITGSNLRNYTMVAFASAASFVNSTLAILVVCRIWYHQKYVKKALGPGYSSIFTRLIHLFVESAALIVVFNVAHAVLVRNLNHMQVIPHQFLVHIYVISALLIIYRASNGVQRTSPPSATIELDTELWPSQSPDVKTLSSSVQDEETSVSRNVR